MNDFDFKKLNTDRVFFEGSYPVLYSCTNEKNELFLTVCCQNNASGKKWLIAKTSEQIIISLLENKISLRNALLSFEGKRYCVFFSDGKTTVTENGAEWANDSSDLPDKDAYLDPDENEYEEDIEYYKKRLNSYSTKADLFEVCRIDFKDATQIDYTGYTNVLKKEIHNLSVQFNDMIIDYSSTFDLDLFVEEQFPMDIIKKDQYRIDVALENQAA